MQNPSLIADRYRILDTIGSGGMGVVLKAHDPVLVVDVAIKMLGKDHTGLGAARLQREATAAGRLSHRNIAKILNFGQTEDGEPYMVMELLEGISLAKLISESQMLTTSKAVPIFEQIAQALEYAHSNQIIHRDLKPSNVMLLPQGNGEYLVKVLDFGVAKLINEDQSFTQTGAMIGSPLYMSPEQAQGDDTSIQSDIYSFGCLMFETLTGQPPFKGASALETLSMHRSIAAPLITDLISVQKLPREIVDLVDECLRKTPANRPSDFKIVLERLKTIREHLDNKSLTREEKQRISNQHFKIKLYHFWKSKFGAIGALVVFAGLIGLGICIFHSEQKRIYESKSATSKLNGSMFKMLENTQTSKTKRRNKTGVFGEDAGLRIVSAKSGLTASGDDSFVDDDLMLLKDKPVKFVYCNTRGFEGSGLAFVEKNSLTELSALKSDFRNENLKYIEKMPNLKVLCIGSDHLRDDGLKMISKNPGINKLVLHSDRITDSGIKSLGSMPNLVELEIKSIGITDDVVQSLSAMKKLHQISLVDAPLSPNIGKKLAKIKALNRINLTRTGGISEESIEALKASYIDDLSLCGMTLDENAFKSLAKLKTIHRLTLGDSRFDPKFLRHLKNLPYFYYLNFDDSKQISDQLINELILLKVQDLHFNRSNITDSQFSKLIRKRDLHNVTLSECSVTQEAVDTFNENYARIWNKPVMVIYKPR